MTSLLIALAVMSLIIGLCVVTWRRRRAGMWRGGRAARRRSAANEAVSGYLIADQIHHGGGWHHTPDHCDSPSSGIDGGGAGCGDAGAG